MKAKLFKFLLFSYLSFFSNCILLQEEFKNRSPVYGYPKRKSIKGIQPNGSNDRVVNNEMHGVAFNFIWEEFQPSKKTSCSSGEHKYDGYCFKVPDFLNTIVKYYTDRGVVVSATIYGVPKWARRECPLDKVSADIFCAPLDEAQVDFGRFTGFIAYYFNGQNGHGRVADFIIHNEVNASEWFNYGCTRGTCEKGKWTDVYADSFNNAYDYITTEQPDAKVLISYEHDFDESLDVLMDRDRPVLSVMTFMKTLAPKLGNRKWRLAYHCYPPDLLSPVISSDDYPIISFGNIGVLAGWLRQNYPDKPESWEIHLTENGFSAMNSSSYADQNKYLIYGVRNVVSTPGIESLIYHLLQDDPGEMQLGLAFGLLTKDGKEKPSWKTYAYCNQIAGSWDKCGFDELPYVIMHRAYNQKYHWVSTRMLPSGYTTEERYKLLRENDGTAGLEMVYECRDGGSKGVKNFISKDVNCEGQFNMGPMGYVWSKSGDGRIPLYRCVMKANGDHFVSKDSDCEGFTQEEMIGYVYLKY
ncbi:MAG: DUF5722 domain-containing protein [archaeon]|nr:DUF5722 domain-containing protein [archaeon]